VVSQGLGLAIGFALSLILVYVVNVQSFGWTIQFHLPWAFFAQTTVLIILATMAAALYPARWAARLALVREE
jgi:putative ABC transport system permease protein